MPKIARATSLPRPDQPGQGDDLPGSHVQRDVDEYAFPGQVLNLQDMIARLAALPGRPLHHLPAHHRPHEIIGGEAPQALVSTCLPSRITVTRWQIAKTSSRRCEMNSTAAPAARSVRTTSNSRPTSVADKAAVGSSITITLAFSESAADLDDLLVGDGKPAADPARVQAHSQPFEQRHCLCPHNRRSMRCPSASAGAP